MDFGFISVAIGVAIMIWAAALAKRIAGSGTSQTIRKGQTVIQQVASPDRQKALQVYENLAKEKLEVIKTALAMGYSQEDLARLDARLEALIGKDELQRLARGEAPLASGDMLQTDLGEEQRRLKAMRSAS
jgi:hypothetical protein